MIRANYTQSYNNDDKKPLKIVCLAFCILLDLIALSGLIACLTSGKYIDLIYYGVIFVIGMAIRIASLFFTYQIIIHYNNGYVEIVKKYPIKEIPIYRGQAGQLRVKSYNMNEKASCKKCVRLCSKCCEYGVYMVELERNYLVYLDDYLYSLIEVNSDIS